MPVKNMSNENRSGPGGVACGAGLSTPAMFMQTSVLLSSVLKQKRDLKYSVSCPKSSFRVKCQLDYGYNH